MKNLSKAARLGKQMKNICIFSVVIVLCYFVGRTFASVIFNI
jgi:hypothetical protein